MKLFRCKCPNPFAVYLKCIIPSGDGCTCRLFDIKTITWPGVSSTINNITIRVRGIVEQRDYFNGANDGKFFQRGGNTTNANGPTNIFRLRVNNDAYYLNRHWTNSCAFALNPTTNLCTLDYTADIQIPGGATVELIADSIEGGTYRNKTGITIPSICVLDQPFSGQFIQVDFSNTLPNP